MEIIVFWNKEKCKWNVHYENEQHVCDSINAKTQSFFKIWPEEGQYRGAVFFYGNVEILINDKNEKLAIFT